MPHINMAALIESTTLPVTALYAGLLSILFAYLALRVGLTRASNGVMHGDGGKQDMVRKARVSGLLADTVLTDDLGHRVPFTKIVCICTGSGQLGRVSASLLDLARSAGAQQGSELLLSAPPRDCFHSGQDFTRCSAVLS